MTKESFLFGWCRRDAHENCPEKDKTENKEFICDCECHSAQEKVLVVA